MKIREDPRVTVKLPVVTLGSRWIGRNVLSEFRTLASQTQLTQDSGLSSLTHASTGHMWRGSKSTSCIVSNALLQNLRLLLMDTSGSMVGAALQASIWIWMQWHLLAHAILTMKTREGPCTAVPIAACIVAPQRLHLNTDQAVLAVAIT